MEDAYWAPLTGTTTNSIKMINNKTGAKTNKNTSLMNRFLLFNLLARTNRIPNVMMPKRVNPTIQI